MSEGDARQFVCFLLHWTVLLKINWPTTLRTVQNGLNIVAASVVSGVSMDCSLPDWDSPWISSNEFETLLSILVPIGMTMLFVLLWTLRSAWAHALSAA